MEYSAVQELYDDLETGAINYKYHHQIANLFQKIRDQNQNDGRTEDAEKAQWEMDCFNFAIQNGELKPKFSGTDDKGQPWEYPSVSTFNEKNLKYMATRLETTSNPVLKARYAHILWASQKKHASYAKIAVDAYLELVRLYEEKDRKEPEEFNGLDVLRCIEAALPLAGKVRHKLDNVHQEMSRLVKEFNWGSKSAFVIRVRLINHMTRAKSKFANEYLEGFPQVCVDLGLTLFKQGSLHQAIGVFEAGQKVDNRLGIKTEDWNRRIAEAYEGLMNQRDESDLAASSFCQNAIEYYKRAGDEKRVQELEKKYDHLKGKQTFHKFSHEVDITKTIEASNKTAEELCKKGPKAIISLLMANKHLLPRYKKTEATADKISKTAVLASIVPVSINDQYGHTAENFTTEEEIHYYHILEQYNIQIMLETQFLINQIFTEAIRKEKLNIYTLVKFLQSYSWYGKNITKRTPQNQTLTYNWLNMIAPGLNDYFNQMKAHLAEPAYIPNFILAMDSLTLKIEGLVRDICTLCGVTTFFQTKDKHGLNIIREKDINWLLREEPIKGLFNEDDLLFFKFILVEKAGLNMRHKIAHCLIWQ